MAPIPHAIDVARVRLDELQENLRTVPTPASLAEPGVLDDLRTALEQVSRTDGELQHENRALRAARREIDAQRERYKALFEFAPGGYLITDADGVIRGTNHVVERLLGAPRNGLIGRALDGLVAEHERRRFTDQLMRVRGAPAGGLRQWEATLRRGTDDTFAAAMSVCTERDAAGRLVELRWLVHDLSETRRVARALAVEEERRAAIVRSIPNGLVATDAEGRIVVLNTIATNLLGLDHATAVGQPLAKLAPALAERPCGEDGPEDIALPGTPPRTVRVVRTQIREGPERGGCVVLLDDVTAERQAKQRLEEQDRLAATGQLAAGIAHDFNNLLSVVIGFADLLRESPALPEEVRTKLAVIAQHGRRGSRLIRQILDFSRRSVTEPRAVELTSFLTEVTSMLARTLPANVSLHLELPPGQHHVHADPTQLQHLVANLALNARDAMPRGGHLRFELSRVSVGPEAPPPLAGMEAGEWIRLCVADTGAGIAPEVRAHVFEPFFTTKPPHQGTGLGLAQVYGIVKQQRGAIDLESVPGWGTRFTVYLPALLCESAAPPAPAPEPIPRGNGEVVLLVEDDPATREVNAEALQYLGYRVVAAESGEEALQLWEQQRDTVAVVLTDLVMPGMGGAELYRALRRRNAALPVVVTSGYPLGIERTDPSLEGISHWLPKPADIEQLAHALHRALATH